MTETGRWIEAERSEWRRGEALTSALLTAGGVCAALAAGVLLARLGVYDRLPVLVLAGWIGAAGLGARGWVRWRRRRRGFLPATVARELESSGGLRRGAIGGPASAPSVGSPALISLADRTATAWLEAHGDAALVGWRTRRRRSIRLGVAGGVAGLLLLAVSGPATHSGVAFWKPATLLAAARGPVVLAVERDEVRRGESVQAEIRAPGRDAVSLLERAPGEAWRATRVPLDSAGRATVSLGPLDADLFLRAVAGSRESETVHVRVAIPAFLVDLSLYGRFPSYLERPDEPLLPGDSALLPAGTRLLVNGRATVPLVSAAWDVDGADPLPLEVDGHTVVGETPVWRGGSWRLVVTPEGGSVMDDEPPALAITVVPDSAPHVSIPVPGADTVAPPSLRQPLVVDVRDDYGVTLVEIESRRAGRLGVGAAATDTLFVPEHPVDWTVLPWVLDLNDRGFLPGDTAYYRVRARDNAPGGQWTVTREYALRLPSAAELREALRESAAAMAEQADSLRRAQEELNRETNALNASQARENEAGDQNAEGMDFEAAERAGEIEDDQSALLERAEELAERLEELADRAWEAGMTDAEWQQQLQDLQELMEQAITPEIQQALEELRAALESLDAEAVQEALEKLAESQAALEEQFERSQELFERAALEGALSSLAEDAEDLAARQDDWNRDAARGEQSDSALAAAENQLAGEADDLLRDMERTERQGEELGQASAGDETQQQMSGATETMRQAASQAQQGQTAQAEQSGQQASQQLSSVSQELRDQLEQMREQWRDEVLQEMDMALTETAELARREQDLTERMERGESGGEVRGEQAAVRESVDRIIERLQDAAGKNALVSPNLSTALGYSRLRMTEALSQFEQATPNTRQAAEMAAQAVDGLNAVAAALMRNRGDVEGAQSGSGMAEAMQQMAEMAAQQDALNGQTGGILPLMPSGGEELIQQLQQLAQQQQSLGDQLDEMAAGEEIPGATDELAEEAMAIAEELRAGRLDRETIERQEQLFRRLLDAGRSLRSDEEDERRERQSETGRQDNVQLPPGVDPALLDQAVRYPYPEWEHLRRFSPRERRIILDYFRRLNAAGGEARDRGR